MIRCVCGKKIGPDPRNFNQRVNLGRNDLLIRTFLNEIISKIGADAVALPENFRIHDLEKFNLNRFRFRGALSTAS
ncbi:DUF2303 family protein, partial [Escherichia coli]|nr:DUF2303 family protein [Escherichia coli]MCS1066986.1 DUF2303 family protein [Escherichia coli]MCS1357906.1 DUF2303 family protein [Escherichia coli]